MGLTRPAQLIIMIGKHTLRRGILKGKLCAALLGAAALMACVPDRRAILRRYRVASARLGEGELLRLAYLSDLHSEPDVKKRARILGLIRKAKPDLILLGGDIFDGRRPDGATAAFLRQLPPIAPTYAAMGNHECRNSRLPALYAQMGRCGIRMLCNEFVFLPKKGARPALWIGGMEDRVAPQFFGPCHWAESIKKTFLPLKGKEGLRILLSHRPLPGVYKEVAADLILSGHAHGGQVRLPGLSGGLYSPDEGLFPRYAGGVYHYGGKTHVVGRGASCFFFPPRLHNPPEVVALEVYGKRKNG